MQHAFCVRVVGAKSLAKRGHIKYAPQPIALVIHKSDKNACSRKQLFQMSQRCRMIYDLLIRTEYKEAKNHHVGIEKLVANNTYTAAYPLHEVCSLKIKLGCHLTVVIKFWTSDRQRFQNSFLCIQWFLEGTKVCKLRATQTVTVPTIKNGLFSRLLATTRDHLEQTHFFWQSAQTKK